MRDTFGQRAVQTLNTMKWPVAISIVSVRDQVIYDHRTVGRETPLGLTPNAQIRKKGKIDKPVRCDVRAAKERKRRLLCTYGLQSFTEQIKLNCFSSTKSHCRQIKFSDCLAGV